ncbi:PLC-like phosphodiesterase [Exophiala viscosa]|uniref:PLC-like phosphodiesterase n=1 Tax=Exophiala viscosa TaxID=2486360 RepID=A0AAN6DRP9_9EURO|nr:PLC-like phosphodiesterase [Exophiala viscosa]
MLSLRSLTYLLPFLSIASAASLNPRETACNNSPDLCSKAYNEIVHLGAHDSPFVRDSSTDDSTSGNQYYNTTVQLSAGVRLVSAQVHESNSEWHLCHSSCDLLDAGLLSDWLKEIKTWLDDNPNEVVTVLLVNSDDATVSELAAQFTTASIVDDCYVPDSTTTPPTTWPTLQEIIDDGKRLMTFVASLDTSTITTNTSYLMDEFTFIFENPYDNTNTSSFTCAPNRPTAVENDVSAAIDSNRMALMNHFLYTVGAFDIETPDVTDINTTNSDSTTTTGALGQALASCKSDYGEVPTFTLVDFFDQGPAIDAVDNMNGVTSPTGRTAVPARDTDETESASTWSKTSFQGVEELAEDVKDGQTPKLGAWIWAAGSWTFGGINLSGGNVLS